MTDEKSPAASAQVAALARPVVVGLLVFTVLTGVVYPATLLLGARLLAPSQAAGSLLRRGDRVVGSELIAQSTSEARHFHPRPSAAGAGHDGASSGGTNLGPWTERLVEGRADDPATPTDDSFEGVRSLVERYRQENSLAATEPVPVDAVTRSGSGLDPHISPLNARLQAGRVARARAVPLAVVEQLIGQETQETWGEPRVNVLRLNLALDTRTVAP